MMIGITLHKKREEHLLTYASGGAHGQIDYLLTRKEHKHNVKDCKAIPGEAVVIQHKPVVMELRIAKKIKNKLKRIRKIRSWK